MTMTKNVNGIDIPLTDEEIAGFNAQIEEEAKNAPRFAILNQIQSLERTITIRRSNEAILGIDNGWLANVNSQITLLRTQL